MPLPADGPESRRAASSSPRRSSASTTAAARRRCWPATQTRSPPGSKRSLCFRNTSSPRRAQPCGGRPTRPRTKRAWSGSASTSGPGTRSRSCSRSGRSGRRPPRRSSSTGRCAGSTPPPTSSCSSSASLALIGSSPETLVKCEDGRASLNPIAGTTHPGDGDAERLLASEKDRAEHVMLVDLGRNDLSRVCKPASVKVARFLEPERFSHVTHLVSEVTGELQDGVSAFDLLRACFPAGTVSGAPKVRAMQIVSELEGYRRGPYAGAVGYVLPGGEMDTCIAIRTIVLAGRRRAAAGRRGDRGRLGSGGGAPRSACQARRARSRDRPRRGRAPRCC